MTIKCSRELQSSVQTPFFSLSFFLCGPAPGLKHFLGCACSLDFVPLARTLHPIPSTPLLLLVLRHPALSLPPSAIEFAAAARLTSLPPALELRSAPLMTQSAVNGGEELSGAAVCKTTPLWSSPPLTALCAGAHSRPAQLH